MIDFISEPIKSRFLFTSSVVFNDNCSFLLRGVDPFIGSEFLFQIVCGSDSHPLLRGWNARRNRYQRHKVPRVTGKAFTPPISKRNCQNLLATPPATDGFILIRERGSRGAATLTIKFVFINFFRDLLCVDIVRLVVVPHTREIPDIRPTIFSLPPSLIGVGVFGGLDGVEEIFALFEDGICGDSHFFLFPSAPPGPSMNLRIAIALKNNLLNNLLGFSPRSIGGNLASTATPSICLYVGCVEKDLARVKENPIPVFNPFQIQTDRISATICQGRVGKPYETSSDGQGRECRFGVEFSCAFRHQAALKRSSTATSRTFATLTSVKVSGVLTPLRR